jgi:hypothetical protein
VECHLRGACHDKTRTTGWYHLDCMGITTDDLEGKDWWCPKCVGLRGEDEDEEDGMYILILLVTTSNNPSNPTSNFTNPNYFIRAPSPVAGSTRRGTGRRCL